MSGDDDDGDLTKESGALHANVYDSEVRQGRLLVVVFQTADFDLTTDRTWSGRSYAAKNLVVWEVLLSA